MSPRIDNQIREDVLKALKWDARITVTVADGVVTLTGSVDSYAVRLLAQEAAQFVEGVFGVNNQIAVEPPAVSWTDIEISVQDRQELIQ